MADPEGVRGIHSKHPLRLFIYLFIIYLFIYLFIGSLNYARECEFGDFEEKTSEKNNKQKKISCVFLLNEECLQLLSMSGIYNIGHYVMRQTLFNFHGEVSEKKLETLSSKLNKSNPFINLPAPPPYQETVDPPLISTFLCELHNLIHNRSKGEGKHWCYRGYILKE